jgi:hypothetical protein
LLLLGGPAGKKILEDRKSFTIPRKREGQRSRSRPENGQPRQGIYPAGAVVLLLRISAKGPVSRILSCAVIPLGAALPRTLISDLPGGFSVFRSRLNASGRCAAPPGSERLLPSLFGLAPCGVYPAPGLTVGAVRSYRTISPLPQQESWPDGRTHPRAPDALFPVQ